MPMHPIDAAHDWISGHPVATMLTLFFVSGLISLYSKEIKGFLHVWPIRTLRAYNRNNNRNRLRLLESLHNNTYQLVIYLALSALSVFLSALTWYALLLPVYFLFSAHPVFIQPWSIILGVATGKASQVSIVLRELGNYERRTEELRTAIEHDESKLAVTSPSNSQL
jgi:hypothetical protein